MTRARTAREAQFLLLGPAVLAAVLVAAVVVSLVPEMSDESRRLGSCSDVTTVEAAFSVPALVSAVGAATAETLPSDQVVTLVAARSQYAAGALVGFPAALAEWGLPQGYPVDRYVAAAAGLALLLGSEGSDQELFDRRWVVFMSARDDFEVACADLLAD